VFSVGHYLNEQQTRMFVEGIGYSLIGICQEGLQEMTQKKSQHTWFCKHECFLKKITVYMELQPSLCMNATTASLNTLNHHPPSVSTTTLHEFWPAQ
jgi:hypothetical protein